MRGGGIRRRRCPKIMRVPGRSRFLFRCHDATNQKLERERGKETRRKAPIQFSITKYRECKVRMHENA